MAISDLLSAADVFLDVSANNKRSLLETLSAEAASRLGCSSQEILEALRAREQIGSTALGRGVALPHAELSGTQPVVLFTRLRRPIDFDARDDEPVDLVFLVLWPVGAAKGLLPAMSEICRALREPQSLRRLRLAETPEEVVQLVRQLTVPSIGQDATSGET
ncbi:PTS sugar transporter subunit IIA [Skermanella rosea]|uniref:PTS sugar transporter subunit IIA n=1 Tax=Skermanella rosea TaxID=1817965 RepID=UPI001932D948|nr:PTS sugar transporter subunit IIA [Skermanella rosea]UEM03436.1 PTS sugar transporter subunit IIA [Skermanella rosea]